MTQLSAPTSRRLASITAMMSIAAALAACGGGGGGDDNPPAPPPPPPSSGPFTITGKATYESVPAKSNGGLNYAGATDKPVRGATVQLIDAGSAVLSTTTSDASGNYSFNLATAQAVRIRVRAEIKRTGSASGDRDITVVDNTASNALYVLDSAAFTPATAAVTQDVRAASGWGGSSYTGTRAAGPFAILDVAYDVQAKIQTAAPVTLPPVKIFWSVNNRPVDGDPATGAIGTSFFTTAGGGGLYILGAANTDTDEYDNHVIAHELGHYLQFALSRDDSVGGQHGGGDKLDMRVAFSEGWGNAWSGIALGNPVYADSAGAMQASGFTINVSTPASGTDRGWYSETASQYLIYTANTTFGFTPIYGAFTALRPLPVWTSLYSFADQLKTSSGNAAGVATLWATQNIVAADAIGTGETNDGGVPSSLPVYKTYATLGTAQQFCVTSSVDTRHDGNKLGEYVNVRFTASGTHTITVVKTSTTRPPPSGRPKTDPDFTLLRSDATTVDSTSGVEDMEILTNVSLPNGTHVIGLTDYEFANDTAAYTSCFNITVSP